MLPSTVSFTYAGAARTLTKTSEQNNSSRYFFRDTTMSITMLVGHTIPQKGKTAESHAVTFAIEHYDAEGNRTRSFDVLVRIRNLEGFLHDSAKMLDALVGAYATMATVDQDLLEQQA